MDGSIGKHELGAHAHEEAVEHVHAFLALDGVHHTAVETSAELDELVSLLGLGPGRVKSIGVNAEVSTGIKSVVHLAGSKS